MESRLWTILPTVLAGILIGAVMMQLVAPPISGTSTPSHTLSTATGCEETRDPRAWIGVVPNSDHRAIYLTNYSYVHDPVDVEILGELTESGTNAWTFSITVTPVSSTKAVPETCQPRSIINGAVALPTTAERLTITINGERITIVETATQAPRFSYLTE